MTWYVLLADLVAAVHLGYVSFVVFGLLFVLLGGALRWRFVRNFWFRAVHLTMILIVVVEALLGIPCPLTVWEFQLRVAVGQESASEMSFVARLVHQLMFFEFSPIVFTVGYCLFGLAVLLSWWLIPPNWPWKRRPSSEPDV